MTLQWPTAGEVIRFSLFSLSSVFLTVDPIASLPAFLAMGSRGSEDRKRRIAKHATWTCLLVLTVFASTGSLIFKLFGITLHAFTIARRIPLFQVALTEVHLRRS